MTTDSEKTTQTTPLSTVDEWLQSLTDKQLTLLRRHKDSQNLPLLALQLIRTGPLSPMQVSDPDGHKTTAMPRAISQALSSTEPG